MKVRKTFLIIGTYIYFHCYHSLSPQPRIYCHSRVAYSNNDIEELLLHMFLVCLWHFISIWLYLLEYLWFRYLDNFNHLFYWIYLKGVQGIHNKRTGKVLYKFCAILKNCDSFALVVLHSFWHFPPYYWRCL